MASFAGGTDAVAGGTSCLELTTRHVNVAHSRKASRVVEEHVPFNPKGILKHLNAAHQVELHIVEGATFALKESNASLVDAHNEGHGLDSIQEQNSLASPLSRSPTHFYRVRIVAIRSGGSGGHLRACSLGRSAGGGGFLMFAGLVAAGGVEAAAVAAGLVGACWGR